MPEETKDQTPAAEPAKEGAAVVKDQSPPPAAPPAEPAKKEAPAVKLVGRAQIPEPLLELVKRPVMEQGVIVMETVTVGRGKNARTEEFPALRDIDPDEVLAWRQYGDQVVVVTTDGQRFSGRKEVSK